MAQSLAIARRETTADWRTAPIGIYSDPIFFSKYAVKVGSKFTYFGRRAHGERYVCEEIWTRKLGPRGWSNHYVTHVQKLDDVVVLRSDRGEKIERKFNYLSYSSIYRLDD